jgi:predicted ATPase
MSVDRFILTGPPGGGKTTLLRDLAGAAFRTVDEAATDVITDWQQRGIETPWTDPSFIDAVVTTQRDRQIHLGSTTATQFYDRSPLCTLALAQWLGYPISEVLQCEIDRILRDSIYRREVFFLRSLGFVTPTEVRRISLADSIHFGNLHEKIYRSHGFELTYVEPGPIQQRVNFIQQCIGRARETSIIKK